MIKILTNESWVRRKVIEGLCGAAVMDGLKVSAVINMRAGLHQKDGGRRWGRSGDGDGGVV